MTDRLAGALRRSLRRTHGTPGEADTAELPSLYRGSQVVRPAAPARCSETSYSPSSGTAPNPCPPRTSGRIGFSGTVADPFMGGGTPLLEANRLGFDVVGADVNPMAWWIVRQELAPLDDEAFVATAEDVVRDIEGRGRRPLPNAVRRMWGECRCQVLRLGQN